MKREKILVNCIDEIRAGKRSLEDCLAEHPKLAADLKAIVGVMRDIDSKSMAPTEEFKLRARNRLRAEIAATTAAHRQAKPGWQLFPAWKLGYALIAVILLLTMGGGAAYASRDSLPGDTFYPVKTGIEGIRTVLAFSPEYRAGLHLEWAERRVQEVADESVMGRQITAAALVAGSAQVDGAFQDVKEIPDDLAVVLLGRISESTASQQSVLERVAVTVNQDARPAIEEAIKAVRRGNMIARVASGNLSLLDTGVSVLDDELEATYFEIAGNVVHIEGQTWNVGGIELDNVNTTEDAPAVGNNIKLYGMIRDNETYIGKIEHGNEDIVPSSLRGVYTGTDDDGRWSVSGIPVGESENVTPPLPGNEVEIKGDLRDGLFSMEPEEPREYGGDEVEVATSESEEPAAVAGTDVEQPQRYSDEDNDSRQEDGPSKSDRHDQPGTDRGEGGSGTHQSSDRSGDGEDR